MPSPKKPKRKSTGKRLRFEIFARDQFKCRYCGRDSSDVKLVLDHINPVIAGGPSIPENLITSCEACNQGKAAKTLDQFLPNDADHLARAQEMQEQLSALKIAKKAQRDRRRVKNLIVNHWKATFSVDSIHKRTLNTLVSFFHRYGATVLEWVNIASERDIPEYRAIKYICGIRRKWCLERPEFKDDIKLSEDNE